MASIPSIGEISNMITNWWRGQTAGQTMLNDNGRSASTREVYAKIDATTAITKGFKGNSAVYAIVMRAARKFGSVPRYVYGQETEQKAEPKFGTGRPALEKLLQRPNPWEGQDAFFRKAYAYYNTCGESFIWLNRGMLADGLEGPARMKMPVLEMFVLPANKMTLVPDDTLFGVYGYILDATGRIGIPKEDVIHWKSTNLDFDPVSKDHLRGFSALQAGMKTLEQNNSATDSAVRMYQNDGSKSVIYNKDKAPMTPQQRTDLQNVIDKKINNVDMKGAVATLQGDWGHLNLGITSVDMELLQGKEMSMKELCFLMGVPYELFDSQVTYANKETAKVGWISDFIHPDARELDGEMNRFLPLSFGVPTDYIGSDVSELPEMRKAMTESAKMLLDNWTVTPNEVRAYLGYEKLPDPQFDEVWTPPGRTPFSQAMMDAEGDALLKEIDAKRAGDKDKNL